jgi:amino acid permease
MQVEPTSGATGSINDFGGKHISAFQSVCLLLNNVTGAAMVLYPVLFQSAGWVAPIACMILIAVLTGASSLCLVKTMQLIPGNECYQQRFEFTNVAKHFLSDGLFKVVFAFFVLSLLTSAIPLIIQSAQVMDFLLVAVFGKTCGLQFTPSVQWTCTSNNVSNVDPFGADIVILSVGVVAIAALCIPIGYLNLDDNMNIQMGATFAMVTILGIWLVFFSTLGLDAANMPAFGTDYSKVLGIVVFNYCFVTAVPSWINEKSPSVSIPRSIVLALSGSTLIFVSLGAFGALAYASFPDSTDVLDKLNQSGNTLMRVTYFLFPFVVNLTTIPIVSIVIKYNFLSNQVVSKPVANFIAVILPWLIAIPLYTGAGFNTIITWTGAFVSGIVNFIVPMYMYVLAIRKYCNERGYITPLLSSSECHTHASSEDCTAAAKEITYVDVNLNDHDGSLEPVADDFVDPLFAISSNNRFPDVGCTCGIERDRCCDRVSWAWCIIACFTLLLLATVGVDVYYLAIGQ